MQITAPLAAPKTGLPVRVEPDLREVLFGEWEGGTYRKNVSEGHPIALRMFAEERWDVIPGGESWRRSRCGCGLGSAGSLLIMLVSGLRW